MKKPGTLYFRGFPDCLLASLAGFEPTTFRLGGGRSILLSYRDVYEIGGFLGLPTSSLFPRWRAFLPVLRRRTHYPAELWRLIWRRAVASCQVQEVNKHRFLNFTTKRSVLPQKVAPWLVTSQNTGQVKMPAKFWRRNRAGGCRSVPLTTARTGLFPASRWCP